MLIIRRETIRRKALAIVNEIEDDMAGRLKMTFNELGEDTRQNILERWVGIILDELGYKR